MPSGESPMYFSTAPGSVAIMHTRWPRANAARKAVNVLPAPLGPAIAARSLAFVRTNFLNLLLVAIGFPFVKNQTSKLKRNSIVKPPLDAIQHVLQSTQLRLRYPIVPLDVGRNVGRLLGYRYPEVFAFLRQLIGQLLYFVRDT